MCEHRTSYLVKIVSILAILNLFALSCQQSDKDADRVHQVGVLKLGDHVVINEIVEGFQARFAELAPSDRFDIKVFNANFDMANLPSMSRMMVSGPSDVLVSITTPASNALVGANRGTKPQIFTFVSDPGQIGYKEPGSLPNVTGLSDHVDYDGMLRLIREIQPEAKKIGYLITQSESNAQIILEGFKRRADDFGFEINSASITGASDLRLAANALSSDVDLFLFGGDNTIASNIQILFDVARSHHLPVFANDELSIENGAIAGISVDYREMGRRTAEYVMFILAGGDPGHIPLETMKAKKLVINVLVADTLNIKIPPTVLTRADRVIK